MSFAWEAGRLVWLCSRHCVRSIPFVSLVIDILTCGLGATPATSHLKVALIESQDLRKARAWQPPSGPNEYANRCSSLTPTSVSFLERIGAWRHVEQSRVQPYQEMHVWDGQNGSKISFDWSAEMSPFEDQPRTVATMIENSNLVRGLLARIEELGGEEHSTVFSRTTVRDIRNGSSVDDGPDLSAWPVLTLSPTTPEGSSTGERTIAARLLVGADGINSPVRAYADITTHGWDYDRHGVVATLTVDRPVEPSSNAIRTAYQRFLPGLGGPIALLPLPNQAATMVWSTTVENAAYLKSLPPEAFVAMVNAAFRLSMTDLRYMMTLSASGSAGETHESALEWRLQHTPQPYPEILPPRVTAVQPGTTASFPLRFRHASAYISPRVCLIGDAAHVVHPLGGQGLNLGLGDVAALVDTIGYAVDHGMDVGDLLALEPYAAKRYFENVKVGAACDLLHKLYTVDMAWHPLVWGRGFGLDLLDRVDMVKNWIMKQAD